jgi:mono/diheme cytochrome c family protein
MRKRVLASLLISPALGVVISAPVKTSKKNTPAGTFESAVQPFLTKNCLMCHNGKLKSGELDLQSHSAPGEALKDRSVWEMVVQKVRSGEMPPKGVSKPKPAEIESVAGWIEGEFDRIDRAAKPDPGRVTARRLNRYEYNNTIRDLLGVDFNPAEDFPADDSGYGFDNIGDVLSISPVLMEKYLAAAEKIARRAVVTEPPQFRPTRVQLKAESVAMGEHLKVVPLAEGAAGPMPVKTALHVRHRFPAQGEYEVRVQFGGVRPNEPKALKFGLWLDGALHTTFDVNPARNEKRNFDFRIPLAPGEHQIGTAAMEDDFNPAANPIPARDRYFTVDMFEVRGPFNPVAPQPPASHARVIACGHDVGKHAPECARRSILNLGPKAVRRPLLDKEAAGLERLFEATQKQGDTFEQGMRVVLQALLVSPHFLFRIERDRNPADPEAAHQISDFELASRLSYFLWSSMPDDALYALAEKGALRRPGVLRAQVTRMLADPKAQALAENFAGQWLQLRNLEEAKPDPDKFRDFDDELRRAMQRETELFFSAIVRENRSILEFLDSDFTFLNDRLASHYGIEGVDGAEFRRVALTGDQRGGVLTQASILTVSSYPTRTSPVIRGKWILENLLNAPPPPPPPGVPNLDEEAVGNSGSLRQQLEKHRSNSVCASCHSRMDPLGFGLENYDAIGAWRTKDGKFDIDSGGTLPNGKSFTKPAELKTILLADKDEFTRCLAEKLLTYALGRGLERFDRPAVQSITRRTAAEGYRFSSLVLSIVESMPFRMRRGEGSRS